jgi:diguanylate cyclase (GGDEF)-like protein
MNANKPLQDIHLGWSPFVVIAVTTLATIAISIYCLLSGWVIIFQNLFYVPIIIACVYYTKKGFAWSVVLSFIYLVLIIAFTRDSAVIIQALIRVVIFVGVAGVTTFLSIKRKQAEEALRKRTHDLGERVKELMCLYGMSRLAQEQGGSLEEILQGTVDLIPPGWQYAEVTCARIILDGRECRTENFRETVWRHTCDIIVNGERSGAVEVCYLEERPESDEAPFLPKKRDLINAIAERLGRIIEQRRAEEALREQARRDPLTSVLNHGAIVSEMRSLISTGERATPWAVVMIDVNLLKVTNDTYGHQAGDAVLVAVATALSRDDALVGRYGGDEFVAILPTADKNAAERYRKDAMDALAHATITDPQTGESVRAEASIGLAVYPEDGSTLADLIKVSDSTMYAAKRQRPVRRPSPRKHAPDRKAA